MPSGIVTYGFTDGSETQIDVSNNDLVRIRYIDGAGGATASTAGGSGGRVTSVDVDVTNESSISLWVGKSGNDPNGGQGRYNGGNGYDERYYPSGGGGGSTEVAFADGTTIAGSGGGGGGAMTNSSFYATPNDGGGGARGGTGYNNGGGTAPPAGGNGGDNQNGTPGGDGDGYINTGDSRVSGGTTTLGGGPGADTDGEIKIVYDPVTTPSGLTITNSGPDSVTLDWSGSGAGTYYVHRAQSSPVPVSDDTIVAEVTAPPYTDTGLSDGVEYHYRVTAVE